MRATAPLALLAALAAPAAAQPADVPDPSTPAGINAIIGEMLTLQRAQLQALLELARAKRIDLDTARACYVQDKAYSEGAVFRADTGAVLTCTREAGPAQDMALRDALHPAPQGGDASAGRLVWRIR